LLRFSYPCAFWGPGADILSVISGWKLRREEPGLHFNYTELCPITVVRPSKTANCRVAVVAVHQRMPAVLSPTATQSLSVVLGCRARCYGR
jgi:hypothetical protein